MKRFPCPRMTAAWLLATVALVVTSLPGTSPTNAAAPAACIDGFTRVAATGSIMPEDVHRVTANQVIAVGGAPLSGGKRAARIATYTPDRWHIDSTLRLGTDAGYVGIGGTAWGGLWSVGYVQTRTLLTPLSTRRRADGRWQRIATPRPAGAGATLTDVAAPGRRSAWAVGYRLGRPGTQKPFALRWGGGKWSIRSPILKSGESGALSGVSSSGQGGTWIAGSVTRYRSTRPYIARRSHGRWVRQTLPQVKDGALAAITVDAADRGWAVGYQIVDGTAEALLLRWDGSTWSMANAPRLDGDTLLFDVATDAAGSLTVVGSSWNHADRRMQGFAATRDGGPWSLSEYQSTPRHSVFTGVDEDPSLGGWLGGRDLKSGIATQTCPPSAIATTGKQQRVRSQRRQATRSAARSSPDTTHTSDAAPAPRSDLAAVPGVRIAPAAGVRMRDRAKAVGLPTEATTYGAVIADFDADGTADIFLNRHSRPAALYLDRGATFERSANTFGWGDRHACAAADVDGNGLPDLYCSFGGGRGLGVKGNQLWLDPGTPGARLARDAGGVVEPIGRGRTVVFMDVDDDGRRDLVVGQQQNRLDGLPSTNRVYLRDGPADFSAYPRSGLDSGLGVRAFDTADIDRDGRVDLLMVYSDPQASGATSGLKIYRNTASGLRDIRKQLGVSSIGERDAAFVRLDEDDWPDLVQLSGNRIRISVRRNGRYKKVYERKISNAVAVAAGDADGDGDQDLFVLRQKSKASIKDLVLFNRGNGRSYRVVAAPSRRGGKADDVVPIDHDGNGLTDFLTLNGGAAKGPVQLISFFR